MRVAIFVVLVIVLASCTDSGNRMQSGAADTSMRSIASSKMINNTTPLPQDSTTTTVTQ